MFDLIDVIIGSAPVGYEYLEYTFNFIFFMFFIKYIFSIFEIPMMLFKK